MNIIFIEANLVNHQLIKVGVRLVVSFGLASSTVAAGIKTSVRRKMSKVQTMNLP